MEENKYYIPTIEEFHVGFEYQIKYWKDKRKWVNEIFEEGRGLSGEIEDGEVRVKFLSKEDIEAEGFKQSMSSYKNRYFIHPIENSNENQNAVWLIQLDDKFQIIDCRSALHTALFYGAIKNRSELKRVLKMIGV